MLKNTNKFKNFFNFRNPFVLLRNFIKRLWQPIFWLSRDGFFSANGRYENMEDFECVVRLAIKRRFANKFKKRTTDLERKAKILKSNSLIYFSIKIPSKSDLTNEYFANLENKIKHNIVFFLLYCVDDEFDGFVNVANKDSTRFLSCIHLALSKIKFNLKERFKDAQAKSEGSKEVDVSLFVLPSNKGHFSFYIPKEIHCVFKDVPSLDHTRKSIIFFPKHNSVHDWCCVKEGEELGTCVDSAQVEPTHIECERVC